MTWMSHSLVRQIQHVHKQFWYSVGLIRTTEKGCLQNALIIEKQLKLSASQLIEPAKKRAKERKVTFELGQWFSILAEELLKDTNAQASAADSVGFTVHRITCIQQVWIITAIHFSCLNKMKLFPFKTKYVFFWLLHIKRISSVPWTTSWNWLYCYTYKGKVFKKKIIYKNIFRN